MTEHLSPERISRRSLLRGTAAAAAMAAGVPLLASCTPQGPPVVPTGPTPPATDAAPRTGTANVRITDDMYGVHVEPSVATNPRDSRQLLAACQVSPGADPEFIATYLSSDAGASWRSGGLPQPPAGAAPAGDDVTVAFDTQGRGYLCSTRAGADRAIYVWRTDDGGRTFSDPVALLSGQYCDHPWLATGGGQTPVERNVYVAWAAGARDRTTLSFTRSTDGGETFEAPRRILENDGTTVMSAGPAVAAGPNGLVCVACDSAVVLDASGDVVSRVVAVCSTDGGRTFGPAVTLGSESSIMSLPDDAMPVSSPTVAAGPDGRTVYVAFARREQGSQHCDIMVTGSQDGGRTWSQAILATPTDDVIYFQPNLTVDQNGRVAISAFALVNGHVDVVVLVSPPGTLQFAAPHLVTTAAFDPANSPTDAGKHGAWWVGDYQGITSGDEGLHVVWNDTRTGKLDLFAATVGN